MLKITACCLCLLLSACASTPNVWLQSRTSTGGVVGYQNYNPSTDNMQRIKQLIHCPNYIMTWNGHKSANTAPTYVFTGAVMAPIGDSVQWTEYHYECLR